MLVDSGPEAHTHDRFDSNRAFHRAVYSACGNVELATLLDRLWDRTERYRFVLVTTGIDNEPSDQDHARIADAVVRRDGDLAARRLVLHLQRSHRLIKRILKKDSRFNCDGPAS